MIDLLHITNLAEEKSYYLLSGLPKKEKVGAEGISVIRLKIIEAGFESIINEELEFPKLLETSIETLQNTYNIFAVFVGLSPEKKSKLRSYKGMFYGLKKYIPEKKFLHKEFSLPNGYSQFAGLLDLDSITTSFFIEHLLISSFAFGLILPEESSGLFSKERKEQLLDTLYSQIIPDQSEGSIEYIKAVVATSNLGMALFRITTDGQDNQYLEFYGPTHLIDATINNTLLPCLKKHFYIRQRQSSIDAT